MTTPAGQRSAPTEATPWLIIIAFGGGFAALIIVWLGGTLGAWIDLGRWRPPVFGLATLVDLLVEGPPAVWPGASPVAVCGGILAAAVAMTVPAIVVAAAVRRRVGGPAVLAKPRDLRSLTLRGARRRARRLRGTLSGRVPPAEAGPLLGDRMPGGQELRSSWEDVHLVLMGPRSGKTTGVAVPNAISAPGPVLLTSNKADVYMVTRAARARAGMMWVFDPQQITHAPRDLWWDMLAAARTIEGARRLSSHFLAASVDAAHRRDFWSAAAHNLLTALFHAAARTRHTVADVLGWLANPADRTPAEELRAAGMAALADQLQGTIRGAAETRDGIYETARQYVACLLDPEVAAWVTPDPDRPPFRPDRFVNSRDTLYLLSKDGGGSAAAVIAAATDAVVRAAVLAAEATGGRLDPPLLPILDEAANICRIEDLPMLYSHLGSRGVPIMTILQSYRQGVQVWGEAGMDALWSAATIKVLGAGLDDADFVEKLSRLIGEDKITEHTISHGYSGRNVSLSRRRERALQGADIRALRKGTALLLATGIRPALIRLRPWYEDPAAAELAAAESAEKSAITTRAARKLS